ncbi:MAG TPA: hypothetical protein VFC03_05665 [Acidimicrobiales bacterium]|nr:hypothetical protein [Acidimicrobiales bacterium]
MIQPTSDRTTRPVSLHLEDGRPIWVRDLLPCSSRLYECRQRHLKDKAPNRQETG